MSCPLKFVCLRCLVWQMNNLGNGKTFRIVIHFQKQLGVKTGSDLPSPLYSINTFSSIALFLQTKTRRGFPDLELVCVRHPWWHLQVRNWPLLTQTFSLLNAFSYQSRVNYIMLLIEEIYIFGNNSEVRPGYRNIIVLWS